MDSGVVASIPLGLIALAAIVLFAGGVMAGWLAARARARRRSARLAHDNLQWRSDLLNALPQASLVADVGAHVIARNSAAAQLLKDFRRDDDMPLNVDAAVGRVIRLRVAETLEVTLPGNAGRRLHVSVSPLHSGEHGAEALVLFTDPGAGARNVEMYQRLTGLI
ncbi:MAG: hypothetical protein ACRDH2_10540, partial [Anaerolineales bacterium]